MVERRAQRLLVVPAFGDIGIDDDEAALADRPVPDFENPSVGPNPLHRIGIAASGQ